MQTHTVERMRVADGTWSVFVDGEVIAERLTERDAADAVTRWQPNPYAVGSIFHTSWGYDQTNVEYYVVVRESAASVWVARCADYVGTDGRLYPNHLAVIGQPTMHRKGKHGVYLRLRLRAARVAVRRWRTV